VGEIQDKIKNILKDFAYMNFTIRITSASKWLVVILNFPDLKKVSKQTEENLDTIAGAIVYALEGNVRYRHYEIHGRTASLVYHKFWGGERVALLFLVKDEFDYLPEFLEHHRDYFDDIVCVIDSRTTDSSADQARKYGARAFFFEWEDDFSAMLNYGMNEIDNCKWIMVLGVDEVMDEDFLANMRDFVLEHSHYDGFIFTVDNQITKDKIPHLRLYKADKGHWEGRVHEIVRGIEADKVYTTDHDIIHHQRWMTNPETLDARNEEYRRLEELNGDNHVV